ncbi:MAG: HD domain-containing protein [Candidatus Hodarchaeota archaeon]
MPKIFHEIRDPIHVFIRLDSDERQVLDTLSFQRLRYIHQLALAYLLYPGATHRRFEHSLGVMELASRVFDVVTDPDNLTNDIRNLFPEASNKTKRDYWRRVIRMAALCHDIGHLPFSHAGEGLLPKGWNHEKLTREIITSKEMEEVWGKMTPPLRSEDIVKLAIGPKEATDLKFSDWHTILSEIIVGDAFGVDRIDYLLRDSHHAGVAYGKFDHYRLIDTLRILPPPPIGYDQEGSKEPSLGVEKGGIHSAEALLLARYFMFSQVYFHHIRRIYDIHLKDFLLDWLPEGQFPVSTKDFISITDYEIMSALRSASDDPNAPGHNHAKRIINRKHFKVIYERNPNDFEINEDAEALIKKAVEDEFGTDKVRLDQPVKKSGAIDFPVLIRDESVLSSLSLSQVLRNLPIVSVGYVFADPEIRDQAEKWIIENKMDIITPREGEE